MLAQESQLCLGTGVLKRSAGGVGTFVYTYAHSM